MILCNAYLIRRSSSSKPEVLSEDGFTRVCRADILNHRDTLVYLKMMSISLLSPQPPSNWWSSTWIGVIAEGGVREK
jgi:hypothetical protein